MEYYDINKLLHAAHFKNFNKIKFLTINFLVIEFKYPSFS